MEPTINDRKNSCRILITSHRSMIIVNYRVNQRAPRLIIPSLPIYAIPSSCLPIHPRDIPPPPILIRFTPPSTVQLFISYDRSGWYGDPEPERNNVSTFLWNVIRDDGWKVSIIISIELWKRERRRKKERKKGKCHAVRLVIRITRRIVRDWYFYASPHPRFSKRTVIEIGRQRRPFPSRGNSIKLFQKEEK